jgi:hypothetical protein
VRRNVSVRNWPQMQRKTGEEEAEGRRQNAAEGI